MKKTILLILITMVLIGCSGLINLEKEAPVLVDAVTDIAITQGDSLTLTLEHVETYDINGDAINIIVSDGGDYTVSGTTIIPESGFVGDLFVAVSVQDETGLVSTPKTIVVSVLPDVREITPLYEGAEWLFADTFFTIDSATTSALRVTGSYSGTVAGISGDIYVMEWTNGDTFDLEHRFHSSDSGSVHVGENSVYGELNSPALKLKFPVTPGESWSYSPIKFDTLSKSYIIDTRVKEIFCVDTAVYTTVPAGTFKCVLYQYSYDVNEPIAQRSGNYSALLDEARLRSGTTSSRAAGESMITVNLYYAEGVGYIKNLTWLNSQLVFKKVLTDYTVEETN